MEERSAREETDCLRDGRLEETTKLRVRGTMCGQNLTEAEKSGKPSIKRRNQFMSVVVYLGHTCW